MPFRAHPKLYIDISHHETSHRSGVEGTPTTLSSFGEPRSLICSIPYLELNLPSHAFNPVPWLAFHNQHLLPWLHYLSGYIQQHEATQLSLLES